MSSNEIPAEVRNSRWWYLIAAVPVVQFVVVSVVIIIFYLVFGLGRTRILGFGEARIAMAMVGLSLLTFPIMIALPYALHRDLELVGAYVTPDQWDIEQHHYTIAAVAGIFAPIIGFGVAVFYLYQRHVHVGVP